MWEPAFFWVTVYLLIGLVCGLSLSAHRFVMEHRPKDFDWQTEIASWARFASFTNWDRKAVIQEVKGILGFMIVWPLLPPVILWDLSRPYYEREMFRFQNNPADQFMCQRFHLTKRVTPEQAEADNLHIDPLGRVPSDPFGHLHPGWLAFLSKKTAKLNLWEFEIPEDRYEVPKWFDRKKLVGFSVKGYALVRGKSVRAEFFTEWNGKQ